MKTISILITKAASDRRRKLQDVDRTKGVVAAVDYLIKKGKLRIGHMTIAGR